MKNIIVGALLLGSATAHSNESLDSFSRDLLDFKKEKVVNLKHNFIDLHYASLEGDYQGFAVFQASCRINLNNII